MANEVGALFVLDCVTSLGGLAVDLDAHGVDAAYSGTQKCLSCPPGLSPVSFSARAQEVMAARERPVQSWYLDLSLISSYWGGERAYHHTAPINMTYALREALLIIVEEGLDARVARHLENHERLRAGLEELGFTLVPGSHPIIPVMLGEASLAQDMAAKLLDRGIYVIGFSFPVVPRGQARIRTPMSAAPSRAELERALEAFAEVGRELGVIE